MILPGPDTTIAVLRRAFDDKSFDRINSTIMTTGRKYAKRTKEATEQRVLDQRTRAVLNAVLNEPRGRPLDAYLFAVRGKPR